ncbi:MAG: hypothetical protein FWE58_06315 [Methanobrevibacter sp.]|nr:hypothetical protein [Methanobrevibacter sp.]
MIDYNLIAIKLKNLIKNHNNRLNIYLIIITIFLALINILFLKNLELGILTIIFNDHFNDFLASVLILAYINICLSFIDYELKSFYVLIVVILLISFVWEYVAIFIKPYSVFDYLDIIAYLIGAIVYWMIINRYYKCI